jgi:BirA family biotin operon repressor/biotin-[acetyl-CoA-carboxylase] ligase
MERPIWERFDPVHALGHRVLGYPVLTSTQDTAWALAQAGAPHGTAVQAQEQSRGRGRFSRRWVAGPGEALLASVLVRPPLRVVPLLTIAATLAVRDAVRALAGVEAAVKWPNDVHVGGRKLAGVLAEGRTDTEGQTACVIGIGLNLTLDPAAHPDIAAVATSLWALTGQRVDPLHAGAAVLAALDGWYAAAVAGEDLLGPWRAGLDTLGQRIRVSVVGGALTGIAEDVDATGQLLLRTDDGRLHTLPAGDVTLAP